MEIIRNINVKAHYDIEQSSKFEALWREYEAAKAIADETEAVKQPLIEAMGKKKLELIKKQLEPITEYAVALAKITGRESISVRQYYTDDDGNIIHFDIAVNAWDNGSTKIYFDNDNIEKYPDGLKYWFLEDGIVTLWNALNVYDALENQCVIRLSRQISNEKNKTERINCNYDRMAD